MELVVEEEEAGGCAGLDGEGGEGAVFVVELEHAAEVDGADDVDVVKDERLSKRVASGEWRVASYNRCGTHGVFEEEPGGFFQAAAGVEQEIVFARDFNAHAEVVFGFQVVGDLVRKVMDIDDDFVDAKGTQAREGDFEQRTTGDFDEGLGAGVGERAQARSEAGGKDHGLHEKTSGEWRVASGEKEEEAKRDSFRQESELANGARRLRSE